MVIFKNYHSILAIFLVSTLFLVHFCANLKIYYNLNFSYFDFIQKSPCKEFYGSKHFILQKCNKSINIQVFKGFKSHLNKKKRVKNMLKIRTLK